MMANFDLSKFKKVASDKKMTTLKHVDGHELKIAHHNLSPKLKSELEKLEMDSGEAPSKMNKPKMAEGGSVHKYAEDGDVQSDYSYPDMNKHKVQPPVVVHIHNAPQPSQTPSPMPTPPPQEAQAPVLDAPVPPPGSPAPTPGSPGATGIADPNYVDPNVPQPDRAPAEEAAPEQPQEQDAQAPPAAPAQQQKEQIKGDILNHAAAMENDLNTGQIKPETYHDLFAKKDTLGKIGSIFGLIVGGAGAGLTHQPNALMEMMNNEISRDLEAQKQSASNRQNFLKIHQDIGLQKAQTDAVNLANAKISMMQTSFHSLQDSVNKMPEGPAKDAKKQALGYVYSQMKDGIVNAADAAAGAQAFMGMMSGGQGSGSQQGFQQRQKMLNLMGPVGENMSKFETERTFPGLKGEASIPLTSGDRDAINSGMDFDQKLHRFMEWTKGHSGDVSPSDRHQGEALAAELQGAYRQATHGGVYKEGEQNFISKLIDSEPTKFFNQIRVLPQLNAIANENQQRVNQLVKSKGFSGYEGAKSSGSKQSKESPYEGKTILNKSTGERQIMKNGAWQKVK